MHSVNMLFVTVALISERPLLLPLAYQHLEISGVWSQDVRLPWVHDSLA